MPISSKKRLNPYVGPRAFRSGEPIFGRESETTMLIDLLIAERIVLLHSPSGAGKTSLIQAALVPKLVERGFRVPPSVRLNQEPSPALAVRADEVIGKRINRYVYSVQSGLEGNRKLQPPIPEIALARMTINSYLSFRFDPGVNSEPVVLIFDQFEEILTIDPTDQDSKKEFFSQLGEALKNRNRWALFAIREDYLGALEPYMLSVPTRFSNTFRLDLLGVQAACEAIQKPARRLKVDFDDRAAQKLIDDLRQVQIQRPDNVIEITTGPYLEPLQLQVVCYRLWEKLAPDDRHISIEDVTTMGDVDQSLAGYYDHKLKEVAQETGASEHAIRNWFERQLITPSGVRSQVMRGPGQGLSAPVILQLEDAHLIRAESRRGIMWYELAHDRLVQPVRKSNAAWAQANLSLLQREAALWQEQHRPEGLLLLGKELSEAEQWAANLDHRLEPFEIEFLEACRKAQRAADQQEKSQRKIRLLAVASTLLFVLSCVGMVAAGIGFNAAFDAQNVGSLLRVESERQKLEAHALNFRETRPDLSLLLSLEANRQGNSARAKGILLDGIELSRNLYKYLRQHTHTVTSVAYTPDGTTLATAGLDGSLFLWDESIGLPYGPSLIDPVEYRVGVHSLAFSPDEGRLAAGLADGMILLWDVSDLLAPTRLAPLVGHSEVVNGLAFSPDSRRLVSGSLDGSILVWDTASGQKVAQMQSESGGVYCVAYSPDEQTMASGHADGKIILWDATNFQEIDQLHWHWREVFSLAFSPDGSTLASGSGDKYVLLWDISKREPSAYFFEHSSLVYSVAFSPDGSMLASGGRDRRVLLWDVKSRHLEKTLVGHSAAIHSLAFNPLDSKRLASGSHDRAAIQWDMRITQPLAFYLTGFAQPEKTHQSFVNAVAFSPDGSSLVSGGEDGRLIFWDPRNYQMAGESVTQTLGIQALSFNPDGKIIATAGCGQWSLAEQCQAGEIRLWDAQTRLPLGPPVTGHADWVFSLGFSPDGKTLATGSRDHTVILWDFSSPPALKKIATFAEHSGWVRAVAFSPDGKTLASAGDDNSMILWDLANPGSPVKQAVLQGTTLGVYSLAFQPNRRILVSGHGDASIHFWDLGTYQEIRQPFTDHTGEVWSLAFSPDGKTLVSGSKDNKIMLWDMDSAQAIGRPLSGHFNDVRSVMFSPDGTKLATGSWDYHVLLWDVSLDHLEGIACRIAARNLTTEEWQAYLPGKPERETCPDFAVNDKIRQGNDWMARGEHLQAASAFEAAVQRAKELDRAELLNHVCWVGSLNGFAKEVLSACERAIELDPRGEYFDSRGLARALLNQMEGAVADFQIFVAAKENNSWMRDLVEKRRMWIAELLAGRNPFTTETLRQLRLEE